MVKSFVDAFRLNTHTVEFNGKEYQFLIEDYQHTTGYARGIIWDKSTDERYHTEGYLQIGNTTIVTKWKEGYDCNRDNWVHTNELVIEIN